MNEYGGAAFHFDITALGNTVSREDDSRSSSVSSGSAVARLDGPRNELSRLLVENDWEDALSVLRESTSTTNGRDDDDADVHIACVAEKRSGRGENRRGMLPLHYACREGAPSDLVRELLRAHPEGASARAEESGRIPLHFVAGGRDDSCRRGMGRGRQCREEDDDCDDDLGEDTSNRIAAARILLSASPQSIQTMDHDGGMSPLHVACLFEAEPNLIAVLVDADESVASVPDDAGNLPLHWIFHQRVSTDSVQRLLRACPNGARTVDSNGSLPLHKACAVGAPVDAIRLLLSTYRYGAQMADNNGNLPLHLIVPKFPGGEAEEHDRDIEARVKSLRELLSIYPQGARARNGHGETPFHRALSEKAPLKLVQLLIDASPDCCNDIYSSSSTGRDSAVKFSNKGCSSDYNAAANGTEGSEEILTPGLTPLHLACRYGASADVVHALLVVNPHQARCLNSDGPGGAHLPIHAACRNGATTAAVEALLEHYPDGAARPDGNDERLPLHLECMSRCDPSAVRALLDAHGAGAGAVDARGRTALHYAAECGGAEGGREVVEILLERFPNALEIRDKGGRFPCLDWMLEENGWEKELEEAVVVIVADGRKKSVRFAGIK